MMQTRNKNFGQLIGGEILNDIAATLRWVRKRFYFEEFNAFDLITGFVT